MDAKEFIEEQWLKENTGVLLPTTEMQNSDSGRVKTEFRTALHTLYGKTNGVLKREESTHKDMWNAKTMLEIFASLIAYLVFPTPASP